MSEDLREAVVELQENGIEGLILDFRFNPGGLLSSSVEVSDMFMEDAVVVSTKGRTAPEKVFETETRDVLTDAPLIVLVNQFSASASEIFAGAVKDNNRGIIIGETTFGKGSVQSVLPLQNRGGALKLTTAAYYTPSGISIEEKGVKPHIEIPLSDQENRKLARHLSDIKRRFPDEENDEQTLDPYPEGNDESEEDRVEDIQLQRAVDAMKALLLSGTKR